MQIDLDARLLTLAAALTAGAAPAGSTPTGSPPVASPAKPEHALVRDTRQRLAPFGGHPSVIWLREQLGEAGLLGLAMQAVQLTPPPDLAPVPPDAIPVFVREYFSWLPLDQVARHLRAFWHDVHMSDVLAEQRPLWAKVQADLTSALDGYDIPGFQQRFFGRSPYNIKLTPLANMAPCGVSGVGAATLHDSYAICLPDGDRPFSANIRSILTLAQHEASHPILDDIQRLHPGVDAACTFVEQHAAPGGRFAMFYGDPVFRWVETVIRASGCFFLEDALGPEAAATYLQEERLIGVAIDPMVDAMRPWWTQRRQGNAPGLDQILPQLPGWLNQLFVNNPR